MRLWIGIHLPLLSLEHFSPNLSGESISVVLEQERVLAMSRAARAAGVKPHMRRGGVLMLAPDTQIHDRSVEGEDRAMQAVALALLQYTPLVAVAEECTLLCDVGASLTLFKGVRALCRRVRADLRGLGFSARISCAPTARGAWMLARSGGGRVVKMETMARRLNALPALVVPAARPYSAWLEGIGCETVAQLRRLPRPGLQRRCGRPLLDTLDAAFGTASEFFEWVEPAETFEAKMELFGRIENTDLLLTGAQRLVIQLAGWLCSKYLAAERVTVFLEHERGRVGRPASSVEIVLAEPTYEVDHIMRLMKERFSTLDLIAPVIGLVLEVSQLRPMNAPNADLFPDPGGSPEDQVRMLEILVSRLGAEWVRRPKPVADHRPEIANGWTTVQEKVREADVAKQLPDDLTGLLRSTWLLAKPIALLMRDERPFYSSPLRMVQGPERIEAAWWDTTAARDYFVAQGQSHELYYVFRERVTNAHGESEPRWFLHGLFG
jgi:protein ImuB